MRLYKVVVLVNLALALGLLAGYFWWQTEVDRLRRDLAAARPASSLRPEPGRSWTLQGMVRGVLPDDNMVVITHEPLPGAMGAMTMGFRIGDPSLTRGLEPGDRVEFTVVATGNDLVVVELGRLADTTGRSRLRPPGTN
jgi:Cu/Ag efflux protein CusF